MKLFFILFSLVIPVLGFAQKNVVVATSADPGHLNPGITTGYNVCIRRFHLQRPRDAGLLTTTITRPGRVMAN